MKNFKGIVSLLASCFFVIWLGTSFVLWEPDPANWSVTSRAWFAVIYAVAAFIFLGANGYLWKHAPAEDEDELDALLKEELKALDKKARIVKEW
ncbi:hypothetical protein GCM10027299_24690 [Larkinella ripae]